MKKVSYIDSNLFSPKDAWDALSMAEKSEMMKVAVQNGITNLDDIRREYNDFAGGGYIDKAKALIKKNEGWMAKPYKDAPKGKSWRSVGYGFNDSGFYDKYPEGISRHYENGITKAQAEQELSYILNKADKHLRSIYGKQWDSFNDNQKAAIMDTYYQRPASVGRKSAFYSAVKSGKDASKYLGVKGFTDRNMKRQSVFSGGAVPAVAEVKEVSLPQEIALQPIVENIPEFIPLNPQAFNTTLPTYQRPELTFEEPVIQETPVSPYSPEEIERQERAEGLANLGRFLSFTNTSGSNNAFLNTIGMLTGNTFAEGGDTNDADLVDWIIREEGFNKKPEDIGDGKMTLGSGLTDPKWHALYKKRGNKWSAEDNRMAVAEEVANRRKWAEKNIPNWNTLPDSAQKALLSYKYNYNFTSANSPKLFQALADSNLYEAAKQMDATSKDPKFKKGLMDRRKREQEWFLSDVAGNATHTQTIPVQTPTTIGVSMLSITEPAVRTAVRNNYVPATTTPYNRGNNMRRAFESAVAFNRMMNATSLQNNPLPEYQFPISYTDGGKIHIDPSKKGTFTAAASKHGMGVQEFASKVLANKENYSPAMVKKANFARNARKWKHGLGGNLYDGTTEDSQKMDNSYTYLKAFDNVYIDKEGNVIDPDVPSGRGTIRLPDLEVVANPIDVGRGKATRLYNDYGIASNDATSTPLTRNIHLNERGIEGAAKAAAWMQDNPTLNNVGMALGAAPFAVAGYPAFIAAGEEAAAALLNPYVDAALASYFGAHGLQSLANGEADWTTALEIAPLGRLAKPLYESTSNIINSAYNRLPWTYTIPKNPNMAYRRMGPLERDWLMEGNELSTRETNALTEAEEEAARAAAKKGRRFSLFKAGAEHGGRKQFAKGQPWTGTTVTHGEEQVLAIPGDGLPWVSGRHYHGPQGRGFEVGDISFEEAPFGSHIDLLTKEGYTGVNPSLLDGSVIYSPYKIFGHDFGYKKLYPKNITRK